MSAISIRVTALRTSADLIPERPAALERRRFTKRARRIRFTELLVQCSTRASCSLWRGSAGRPQEVVGISNMKRAALGVRMHSGWGVLVAISGDADSTEMVDRRRIVVTD